MVKVVAYIRCSPTAEKANIRFRLTDGNKIDITHTSDIVIHPLHFDAKKEQYKAITNLPPKIKTDFNLQILKRKELLIELYESAEPQEILNSKWFNVKVSDYLKTVEDVKEKAKNKVKTEKVIIKEKSLPKIPVNIKKEYLLIEVFTEFLEKHKISEVRKKNFRVLLRVMKRYELYCCYSKKFVPLTLDAITTDMLFKIEYFFKHEHELATYCPNLYTDVPETRTPKPRGDNTISDMLTKFRTFLLWCIKNGKTTNNPFLNFQIKGCVYGSPIFISLDELRQIYLSDLSQRPALAIQRDIFVFNSQIGCRVSDLLRLTDRNVIDDAIEYIPNKAKHIKATTLIVPLNDISREIIERYKGGKKLLPFISEQKYNKAIKDIFRISGITRMVSILNPLTREEEQVPINTIASSHMCRRNLIGNLYNIIQDTNIIGSMTGHAAHSRAFARYRNIEKGVKKSVIDKLNFNK